MHYLDNAATTRPSEAAVKKAEEALRLVFGNPSSLHTLGFEAQQLLETSRAGLAAVVGCAANELYFTASGTEADNIALRGACEARRGWANRIVISGYEHPAVSATARALESSGFETVEIPPDKNGHIDTQRVLDAVDEKTAIVSVMHINNEIGTVFPVAETARLIKQKNRRTVVHSDCVQSFLKAELPTADVDMLSVSGHKVHAPKGIGALYVRKGLNIITPLTGGGQERGLRSGTENVAFAAAFAEAVKTGMYDIGSARELCDYTRARLAQTGAEIISPPDASPYVLCAAFKTVRAETMLHFLAERGIYVSAGSACSKGAVSHTLAAMGVNKKIAAAAVRISFGCDSSREDADALCEAVKEAQKTLIGRI